MRKRMCEIWNFYLPFVRHYGEDLLCCFHTIQYADLGDTNPYIYLKATQILEACQRRSDALCGCIFSEGKVIVSQVSPDILRFLTCFKPGQLHLPISQVEIDGSLPYGVRVFDVNIDSKSYKEIGDTAKSSPYSFVKLAEAMSSENILSSCVVNEEDILDAVKDEAKDRCLKVQMAPNEDYDNHNPLQAANFYFNYASDACLSVNSASLASDAESSLGDCSSPFSDYVDISYPQYNRTISDDLDVDTVWDKKYGGDLEDLRESVKQFNMCFDSTTANKHTLEKYPDSLYSDDSSSLEKELSFPLESAEAKRQILVPSNLPNNANADAVGLYYESGDNTALLERRPHLPLHRFKNSLEVGNSSLSHSIETVCNHNSKTQEHLIAAEKDFLSNEEIESCMKDNSNGIPVTDQRRIENCVDLASNDVPDDKTMIIPQRDILPPNEFTSTECSAIDLDHEDPHDDDSNSVIRTQGNASHSERKSTDHNSALHSSLVEANSHDVTYRSANQEDMEDYAMERHETFHKGNLGKHNEGHDQELETLKLYVQSHSNTIIVIFLDPKSRHDVQMLRSIYEIVVPQLGDLEGTIQNSRISHSEPNKSGDFVYFMYDNIEKKYQGGRAFISQEDYTFAGAIKSIHSQFKHSSSMIDATFRDYNKAVYGKRTLHQETYYQPRGTYKSHQGAPTPYDMSCAIDRRISSRLRRGTDGIVL